MKKRIVCTFLAIFMTIAMMSVLVSANTTRRTKKACVGLPGVNSSGTYERFWSVVDEGQAKYYLSNDDGLLTETGASAGNYNVKLEYPAGGTPTLSLKNAKIYNKKQCPVEIGRKGYGSLEDITEYPFVLNVESDSTINAQVMDLELNYTGFDAIYATNRDTLTITGPGKLTVISESNNGIKCKDADLVFKNANLEIETQDLTLAGNRHGIMNQGGNIVVDNSTLKMTTVYGRCMVITDAHHTVSGRSYNITVKNGSQVTVNNTKTSYAAFACVGEVTFDHSTVEIISRSKSFDAAPTLIGVGAIAGKTASDAKAYNEKQAQSYTYFKCGTDIVVPTEPATEATTPATQATTPGMQATQPVTQATTPVTQATTPTTPATTPVTQATTPATQGTTPAPQETSPDTQATTPAGDSNTDNNITPPTSNDVQGESQEEGSNVLLYITLGVLAAVLIAAGVIVAVVSRRRADEDVEEVEKTETE